MKKNIMQTIYSVVLIGFVFVVCGMVACSSNNEQDVQQDESLSDELKDMRTFNGASRIEVSGIDEVCVAVKELSVDNNCMWIRKIGVDSLGNEQYVVTASECEGSQKNCIRNKMDCNGNHAMCGDTNLGKEL